MSENLFIIKLKRKKEVILIKEDEKKEEDNYSHETTSSLQFVCISGLGDVVPKDKDTLQAYRSWGMRK